MENKGQFIKGIIPWNKGTKGIMKPNVTSFKKGEHRSLATEFKKGMKVYFSPEHRRKLSEAGRGRKMPRSGVEKQRQALIARNLKGEKSAQWKGGKPKCKNCGKQLASYYAQFCKKHWTVFNTGKLNSAWKGGVTPINEKIRKSLEYKQWRKAVFERDDYRCFDCGERGGKLEADHIYPFSLFPRLRFMLENGRTLCKPCHLKTSTWGGRVRQKIIQYA